MRRHGDIIIPSLAPFSVVIVDPGELSRVGCRSIFQADARFSVLADAATPESLVSCSSDVDLLIVEPAFGGEIDTAVLPSLMRAFPNASCLLLTDSCDAEYLQRARHLGARGFLKKSHSTASIILEAAFLVATRTTAVVDLALFECLTAGARRSDPGLASRARKAPFTGREMEILHRLAEGASDSEVAQALGIAATTVQTHVGNILRKAGVATRVQLGVYALASQIIGWPEPEA